MTEPANDPRPIGLVEDVDYPEVSHPFLPHPGPLFDPTGNHPLVVRFSERVTKRPPSGVAICPCGQFLFRWAERMDAAGY